MGWWTRPPLTEELRFYVKGGELVITPTGRGRLRIQSPFAFKDELRAMEGATWDKAAKRWSVLDNVRNQLQIEVLRGSLPPELIPYTSAPPENLKRSASGRSLWAHQQLLVARARHCRGLLIAAWMGVGKSLVAIEVMESTLAENAGELAHGLVAHPYQDWWYIAPDKAQLSFKLEMRRWHCRVKPRIMSPDSLRGVMERWDKADRVPLGIIVDESSRFKSPDSQRTEALLHLATAVRVERHGFVIEMSGTPAPQDPNDWWSQTEIACPGWLRESNRYKLDQRLSVYETVTMADRSFPKRVKWKEDERQLLSHRLAGPVIAMRMEDTHLNLPPPRYEVIRCPVGQDLVDAAWLLAQTADNPVMALRQLSDGFQYASDGKPTIRFPTPKEHALSELLERHEEAGRLAVYAGFTEAVDRCVEVALASGWEVLRCDGRGWSYRAPSRGGRPGRLTHPNHEEALLAMQTPGDPDDRLCFVGHPGAGGFGLNMQGLPAIVFYSNSDSAEHREQAEARGRRPGMDVARGLIIYSLVCLGTDELVETRLRAKRDVQTLSMAEVREALGVRQGGGA